MSVEVLSTASQLHEKCLPKRLALTASVAVRTAGDSRRTAGAADEQCLRCGCSSLPCTVVLCAADIDGPLRTACTAPAEERPASADRRATELKTSTACELNIVTVKHTPHYTSVR